MKSKNQRQKYAEESLDIALLRMGRKNNNMGALSNQTMGSTVDEIEARNIELELAIQMLTSSSSVERQRAEELIKQITLQLNLAEEKLLSLLNSQQKLMYDKIYSQVKISEDTLKFKGTDLYDLSFVRNFDYSKIVTINDASFMESRLDRREEYRQQMRDNKKEVEFAIGLIKQTDASEYPGIIQELYNQKHYYLKEYYMSCIRFYQEATVIGFLTNPTNNIENLKQFIYYNDGSLQKNIDDVNFHRLELGEERYKAEMDRLNQIDRMVKTAKARLKYLQQAYDGLWIPPTFDTLTKYAEANDMTYSRAVYEMNEKTRSTLCVPDWILSIAEMYNMLQKFEEPMTELNPYDSRWIRKAKEVVNMESVGVKYTAEKLFKAIDEYWIALTFGMQELEDLYLNAVIEKALKEDRTASVPAYSNDLVPIDFDEDLNPAVQGFPKSVFKAINKVVNKTVKLVKNAAGVLVDAARVVTVPVAKATKAALDNTLGRVLPSSIYDKIATFTDIGLDIMKLNVTKQTFRNAVKSVTDLNLISFRINTELIKQAKKVGVVNDLDRYSGGLLTSYGNLQKAPITLGTGGKINWTLLAIDAIKVGLAAAAGASVVATQTTTSYIGTETGLNKTSLGQGILTAGALIATGQADFSSQLASGATVTGTKAIINNTALGDSSLGRTVASIGVAASVQSIQTNEAFSQIMRDKAEDELRALANRQLKDATGGLISLNTLEKGYDILDSDKTLAQFIEETKNHYTQKFDELVKKAENLTQEEIEKKASAEADRFLQKRIDETYKLAEKYGEKMVTYLFKKYGPKSDYDSVIQPDDFLNYQIDVTKEDDRIFQITYKTNTGLKVAGGIAAVSVAAYLLSENLS